jgi:hypothetical protein
MRGADEEVNRLVVHEWGTFTSVAGEDGVAVDWHPLNGPSDLPKFVYDLNDFNGEAGFRHGVNCVKCDAALIRMETPVVYFYPDRAMEVSVRVRFPQGRITEWYPQARFADEKCISWGRFSITPGAQEAFPSEPGQSHYYAARETDAAPVRVCGKREVQHEKFLFYRGLGNFNPPLAVALEGDSLIAKSLWREEIAPLIVFENRGGRVGYFVTESFKSELKRPALDRTVGELEREIETTLIAHGLYVKEAKAMIKTWRDSWFEEGLRVFYIMPRGMTDTVLPIQIEPRPSELVRVFVGRIEIPTPEMEHAISAQISELRDPSASIDAVAGKIRRERGRFAEPVLRRILEQTGDAKLRARIEQLIKLAAKPAG